MGAALCVAAALSACTTEPEEKPTVSLDTWITVQMDGRTGEELLGALLSARSWVSDETRARLEARTDTLTADERKFARLGMAFFENDSTSSIWQRAQELGCDPADILTGAQLFLTLHATRNRWTLSGDGRD